MTVRMAYEEFLIEQEVRGNSPATLNYYRRSLTRFTSSVGSERPMEGVSLSLLKQYVLQLQNSGLGTISVQTYVRALRSFLRWCYGEGYMSECLTDKFRLPRAKRPVVDVLTDAEVQRLFSACSGNDFHSLRDTAICSIMLGSGLRLGEVVTLPFSRLHLPEGYVIVDGKGGKQRMIPVGLHTKKALLRYLGVRPPASSVSTLFVTENVIPLSGHAVKLLFARLRERSKIPRLHAHLLRHSFATRYLEGGGDIYSLQQILGHTSLEMVKKYVHMIPGKMVVMFSQFSPLDRLQLK